MTYVCNLLHTVYNLKILFLANILLPTSTHYSSLYFYTKLNKIAYLQDFLITFPKLLKLPSFMIRTKMFVITNLF